MNQRLIFLSFAGCVVAVYTIQEMKKLKIRKARKRLLNEIGLDVAAIHRATDVVNGRIERGEIRSLKQLEDAVLTEVAFQKITIREQ